MKLPPREILWPVFLLACVVILGIFTTLQSDLLPPAVLAGRITAEGTATLEWPPRSSGLKTGFQIERKCDDEPWEILGTVPQESGGSARTVKFVDDFVMFGSVYRYRVRSLFGAARSAPSSELIIDNQRDSNGDLFTNAEEMAGVTNPLKPEAFMDTDGDGVLDAQEILNGTDPKDYYNGASPVFSIVSGANQTGLPNRFYPEPLVLRVGNAKGEALVEAPVSVEAGGEGGRVGMKSDGKYVRDTLTLITDDKGEVSFYLEAPAISGQQFFLAKAGSRRLQVPVNVDYSIGAHMPKNLKCEWMGNGTRLTWEAVPSSSGSLEVERSVDQILWKVVQKLPSTAVGYEDHYVSVSPVVYYRVTFLETP